MNHYNFSAKVWANIGLGIVSSINTFSHIMPINFRPFFHKIAKKIGLNIIGYYKKQIDPYKKGNCAYSISHGGNSCSNHIKTVLENNHLNDAIPKIKQRFKECKEAHLELEKGSIVTYGDHNDCIHINCSLCGKT